MQDGNKTEEQLISELVALRQRVAELEEVVGERTKELREFREQLVRKERLAVLGRLAGGVAHELRSPLGVISNAVYYLKMVLPDADETTRKYLKMISEEVRNAEQIVSDLLDFSHTRLPHREKTAISELVAEVLERRPPPEAVEVVTHLVPDLPAVHVDPRQIGLLMLASALIFGIPWGEPLAVASVALGLVVSAAGFGVLLMSFVKSTRQSGPVVGGVLTVTGMAGGLFTTGFQNLPAAYETINLLTPQGWALRGWKVVLAGGGVSEVLLPTLVTLGMGTVFFAVGALIFRRRFA